MNIALVQIQSFKGDIPRNLARHIQAIEECAKHDVDLIIFPELSITGYEPELAEDLAIDLNDPVLNPLQELSNTHKIVIGVGMPINENDGITISMIIFSPHSDRALYSKCLLHDDELPYFVAGSSQPALNLRNKVIGLGICYETLQEAHFKRARVDQSHVFIASVAKPDRGTTKAFVHFPEMAQKYGYPILMVNAIGPSDNFICNGKSAVWDTDGNLINQLSDTNEGVLIYSMSTESSTSFLLP